MPRCPGSPHGGANAPKRWRQRNTRKSTSIFQGNTIHRLTPAKKYTSPWLIILLLLTHAAFAATPNDAVVALREGDYDKALDLFQKLQLEQPDNPQVLYGLGCVQYRRGMNQMQGQTPYDAQATFTEAHAAFSSVVAGSAKELHADAGFNLGNVLTQEAQLAPLEEAKVKIAKWRVAIGAYERVLENYPDHAGAKQNLDYARYQLKVLLQEGKMKPSEDPSDEPPHQVATLFQSATTDLPGAQAVPKDNTVQLIQPGATAPAAIGGAKP